MGVATNGSAEQPALKFLIYGRTGWIGGLLVQLCAAQGIPFAYGAGRLENRAQVEAGDGSRARRLASRESEREGARERSAESHREKRCGRGCLVPLDPSVWHPRPLRQRIRNPHNGRGSGSTSNT